MVSHRFKNDKFESFNHKFKPEKLKKIESHDQLKDMLKELLNYDLAPILEICGMINVCDPFVRNPNGDNTRSDIYFNCSEDPSIPITEVKTAKVLTGGGFYK